jgi:hypothetical protein
MDTIRISPTEVQLRGVVYVFADDDVADGFEECIETVGTHYCEQEHRPVSKRLAEPSQEDN